jgi:uncharacterized protein
MRKLTQKDRKQVLDYVMQQPEFNLFIIGDIENFGFDNQDVEVFVNEEGRSYDCLLLRYLDNYIIYSHHFDYDAEKIAEFLSRKQINCISGKGDVVEKLLPYFPDKRGQSTYLARLNGVKVQPNPPAGAEVRRLKPEDASDIVSLYLKIEEFRDNYSDYTKSVRFNLENGGRSYGAYLNGKLMSIASTSAENSVSAMIVGVATLPNARNTGLASSLVAKLCYDFLNEGKQFLCLFYDNPAAGSIYRKIGFAELGNYMMMKKKKEKV